MAYFERNVLIVYCVKLFVHLVTLECSLPINLNYNMLLSDPLLYYSLNVIEYFLWLQLFQFACSFQIGVCQILLI
ncbi:hypothetical protein BD408DRAFT_425527 [Parasitella parasitica]|nr:hypothetical protein BD408DRAFT_425527 [Parasitella parasitica]